MSTATVSSFPVLNSRGVSTIPQKRERAPRLDIGALGIDLHTREQFVEELLHHALSGSATRQVVTANAQFYVLAGRSRRVRACIRKAEYVCADGMPIAWSCRAAGSCWVPRIAGVDLVEQLCRQGASSGLRVLLLGGSEGSAAKTSELLRQRYPGIDIVAVVCPPLGFHRNDETLQPILQSVIQAKPHVVFVGLGAPKQELFIDEHIRALGVPLAVGVGGTFEIISGKLRRAPLWMQRVSLEWAFRLFQEPQRLWRRYLVGNLEFIWRLGRWALVDRRSSHGRTLSPTSAASSATTI